jgi:hypothetical protein
MVLKLVWDSSLRRRVLIAACSCYQKKNGAQPTPVCLDDGIGFGHLLPLPRGQINPINHCALITHRTQGYKGTAQVLLGRSEALSLTAAQRLLAHGII